MDKTTTSRLMEALRDVNEAELEAFAEAHGQPLPSLGDYWAEIIAAQPLSRREIIRRADFSETYGYKLLSGENRTSERDYVLRLCIAMGMSLQETQRALELNEMRPLYPKDRRDMALIVAVNSGMTSVDEVNALLARHGCQPLKRSGGEGDA